MNYTNSIKLIGFTFALSSLLTAKEVQNHKMTLKDVTTEIAAQPQSSKFPPYIKKLIGAGILLGSAAYFGITDRQRSNTAKKTDPKQIEAEILNHDAAQDLASQEQGSRQVITAEQEKTFEELLENKEAEIKKIDEARQEFDRHADLLPKEKKDDFVRASIANPCLIKNAVKARASNENKENCSLFMATQITKSKEAINEFSSKESFEQQDLETLKNILKEQLTIKVFNNETGSFDTKTQTIEDYARHFRSLKMGQFDCNYDKRVARLGNKEEDSFFVKTSILNETKYFKAKEINKLLDSNDELTKEIGKKLGTLSIILDALSFLNPR